MLSTLEKASPRKPFRNTPSFALRTEQSQNGRACGRRKRPAASEAFAYSALDNEVLAKFLPGVGSVRLFRLRDLAATSDQNGDIDFSKLRPVLDSSAVAPPPPPHGFWDFPPFASWPLIVRYLDTGANDDHGVNLTVRPSALVGRLLSPLGSLARPIVIGFFGIVGAFIAVELIAAIFSAQLARSITRTIHDLYTGTKKVETGDLSHRIPVHTKDQLSELAASFNSMTQRIERMIVELKDKEKLEAELEIARQVQAQLFPKEIPKLRTLELKGLCKPARVAIESSALRKHTA